MISMRKFFDAVLLPIRLGALRALISSSPKTEVRGLRIVDVTNSADSSLLLQRVQVAVEMIADADRRRFFRARQDLKWIVLSIAKSAAEYVPAASICIIDVEYVRDSEPLIIASSIVHEATHARIDNAGISYDSSRKRARIERRCVREEISFIRLQNGSEELVKRLESGMANEWWTEERIALARLSQLRRLGVPDWALNIYRRFLVRLGHDQ